MRWTHKCCFQWHLIFFTDCSPKLEYLHWIYSEEKPKIKERQRGWVLHSRQVMVLKWDPRRSGARCVQELTRGKRALVFLKSRASISRSTNKQPFVKLGENKTVLWNKQWTLVLKWKRCGEHESFRAGGIKPFLSKSRAWRPQSNSTERSPKQSLTKSSVVCKFIEIQSLLPTGRWVRCDPSSQPTLTQAADIVVLKISLLFLLPARGRGRERGRGKRRMYRARECV